MTRLIPIVAALLGAAAAAYAAAGALGGETREITVVARQYAYEPARIHVNKGDTIKIRIYSTDVVHGFYLEGHDINATVVPQQVEEIVFEAERRGKFRYRCSQTCGSMHPFMTGELVVGPNSPLHAGLGGLIGLTVGLFIFFAVRMRTVG
jgi:cytochrome c oxidase subunit 2